MSKSNGHRALTRAEFLARPLKRKEVAVPEFGTVLLQELTARQRWEYEDRHLPQGDGELPEAEAAKLRRRLIAAYVAQFLVDDAGERLFGDSDEEIDALEAGASLEVLKYLHAECTAFYGWTQEAVDKAKEELAASPLASP